MRMNYGRYRRGEGDDTGWRGPGRGVRQLEMWSAWNQADQVAIFLNLIFIKLLEEILMELSQPCRSSRAYSFSNFFLALFPLAHHPMGVVFLRVYGQPHERLCSFNHITGKVNQERTVSVNFCWVYVWALINLWVCRHVCIDCAMSYLQGSSVHADQCRFRV